MKELSGAELAPMLKSSIQLKSLDGVRVPGLKLSEEDMQWWRDAKLGSDFRYEALQLSSNRVESGTDTEIQVACRVTNISECEGEEVVQLYVRAEASRVKRPRLQLADFKRIALAPGESAEVTFRLQLEGRLTVAGETIPPRDLTWRNRAANYDGYQGIHLGECVEGGSAAAVNGDRGWLAFHDAELGAGISAIELLAAATENAAVEVRLLWQGGYPVFSGDRSVSFDPSSITDSVYRPWGIVRRLWKTYE